MPALPVSEYAEKINSLDIVYIAGPDDLPLILPTLKAIATSPGPFRGLDTETLGLSPRKHRVRTIQFASETTVLVVDLDAFRSRGEDGSVIRQVDWDAWPALKRLKNYIEQTDKVLTLHNAGFDINMLACEGFKFTKQKIFDTLVASKIINNGTGAKNGLGDVVQRRLGFPLEKELQRSDFSGDLSEEQIRYGALDAVVCVFLAPVLEEVLQSSVLKEGKTLYMVFAMEMACVLAISLMRHVGFGFNVEKAKQLHAELLAEADTKKLAFCEALDAKMRKRRKPGLPRNADGTLNLNKKTCGSIRLGTKVYAGFNPGSTKQLIPAFTAAGVKLSFDSKGKHSLDQNLLAFIRDKVPLVDMYLTWKAISTRASSVESLLAAELDGRIYATYKQLGCQTGRLSCVEPNLQQVPKESEFRGLFIPRPGYKLIVADYGQVELRIVAHLAQEPRMIQAYKDGRDLHRETASLMKKVPYDQVSKSDRSSAKICFSGDTEVLTPDGWVALSEYAGQQVAQYTLPAGVELNKSYKRPGPGYVMGCPAPWDGNNGVITYTDPIHYESFYSDDVWHSHDRNHDIVATRNHHILYIDACGKARKKPLVEVRSPRNFVAAGYYTRTESPLGELRSRVLSMIVADGSFKGQPGFVRLGFSKRRKVQRCEQLLKEAGIEAIQTIHNDGAKAVTTFRFRLEQAVWLMDFVDEDKKLRYSTCMEQVDALAYLAEAQYWDGVSLEGENRDRIRVSTIVKETADVMQAMAVTAGLPCTIHEEKAHTAFAGFIYIVSYVFRQAPVWRPSWNPVQAPAQNVYCVQVPSELILVRRNGKVCVQGNCNFGLIYGAGPATLRKQAMSQYGVLYSLEESTTLVQGFRESYPTLHSWQKEVGTATTASLYTLTGRRRTVVGSFDDRFTVRCNTPVQGTAGDIAKIAIGYIWQEIISRPEGEAELISMVHDELILEAREDVADTWASILQERMEQAGRELINDLPIVAEVSKGDTWAEAK